MTTERDSRTRLVLSWLREDLHENAERVLLEALDEIDTTPQRRSWWPAWRITDMNRIALTAAVAAAVLVIAVAGYNLLPRQGAGGPNATPSPTPAPLAVGSFTSHGVAAQLDAKGSGPNVTGSLTVSDEGGRATVALECSRRADGLLFIGGLVSDSTYDDFFPEGRRVGVVFEPGPPVKAVWLVALIDEAPAASCEALADDLFKPAEAGAGLEPIDGTVTLAP